jgi:1-acyl-sn-glycerol-3-phosphate acyltransferase
VQLVTFLLMIIAAIGGSLTLFLLLRPLSQDARLGCLALLAAAGAALAWKVFAREFVETPIALVQRVMYRLRTHGPGLAALPKEGPLLIISNHTCWLDPLWHGTVLPRPLIPMMTSLYYDKPIMRWFMANIFRAIRVPAERHKQEVPDLNEAVQRLEQGQCVILFPEGWTRRRDDQPLRRFGRGVWYILQQLPETPVVACWIEGGWGSYTSYRGGPPMTNKPFDLRRPIDIAISAPKVLDPNIVADHRATRTHLFEAVAAARQHLGLPSASGEPD